MKKHPRVTKERPDVSLAFFMDDPIPARTIPTSKKETGSHVLKFRRPVRKPEDKRNG